MKSRAGWVLWFQWLLANVVGRGVAFFLSIIIVSLVSDFRDQIISNKILIQFLIYVPLGILFGLGLGTAQWLVLRTRLDTIRPWISASVLSWALGGIAGTAVYFYECPLDTCGTMDWVLDWVDAFIVGLNVVGIAGGILMGIGQWLILRRRVHQAGWWLLTAIGEATPWLLIWTFYSYVDSSTTQFETRAAIWIAVLALWAIAYATLPGILLVWLLRKQQQEGLNTIIGRIPTS